MGSAWNCDHMCDDGIQQVVDGFVAAVKGKIHDKVNERSDDIVELFVKMGFCKDNGVDDEFRISLIDILTEELSGDLENALEDIVQSVDSHCDTIKSEAFDSGSESSECYECETNFEELSDAKKEIEKLEEKIEEADSVQPHGFTKRLNWVSGQQVFACPVTGRTYKLVEDSGMCPSMVR